MMMCVTSCVAIVNELATRANVLVPENVCATEVTNIPTNNLVSALTKEL